jgi:deazaflavin-dependent oxidoreductase (nitroreductase family)
MFATILTILAGLVLVAVAGGIVFVLGMRAKSPVVLRPLFWFSKRFMNPAQMRTAGTPGAYASIVRVRGRVSGRVRETPVGVIPEDGGFLIALPYGSRAQWLRNVLAAGTAELMTEGRTHRVDRPQIIPAKDVADRFSATDQRLFRALATTECLRLRRVATLDDEVAALAA